MEPVIQMVIEATPDGKVRRVGGPLENKVLCYGLLEAAKDVIRDFVPQAVQVPTPEQARLLTG